MEIPALCFGVLEHIFGLVRSPWQLSFSGISLQYNASNESETFECIANENDSFLFALSSAINNTLFSLTEVCLDVTFLHVVDNREGELDFVQSKYNCEVFGGRLIMVKELQKLERFLTSIYKNYWLSWVYQKKAINFRFDDENNFEHKCEMVYAKDNLESYSVDCLTPFRNTINICLAPRYKNIYLYGSLVTSDFDHLYFLSSKNNNLQLISTFSLRALYPGEKRDWLLKFRTQQEKAILENVTHPFGRKFWTYLKQKYQMTLTACSKSEFTCTNGKCLPKSALCNNTIECEDASDEEDCSTIVKKRGYQMRMVPPPRQNDSMFTIDVYGGIAKLGNIFPNDEKLTLEVYLIYEWYDPRLVFCNPFINQTFDCNEIWSPKVGMMDDKKYGFQVEFKDVFSECSLLTSRMDNSKLQHPIYDSYMGNYYICIIFTMPYSLFC